MIYFIFGKPEVLTIKTGTGLLFDSLDWKCQLKADELVTLFKDNNVVNESIYIGQQWLEVYRLNDSLSFSDAQDGNIYVTDEVGKRLDLAAEIAYLLACALPDKLLNPYVIGNIRPYKDPRSNSLFLANIKDNEFVYRKDYFLHSAVLEKDGIYGFHHLSNSLKKLDYQLNDVWTFTPVSDSGTTKWIIPYKDKIIYYPGEAKGGIVDKKPIPDYEHINYTHVVRENGTLYGLDRDTGDIVWQRLFAIALNDVVLHEDKLYAVGEYDCYRLSVDTGEIECQQQMAYNAGGKLYNLLTVIDNKLWVIIEHAYFQTHCLLILNLDTLALEHKIDIPAPYAPDKFLHYDEAKRQVFYRFKHRYDAFYQEHLSPLLVIDLDDLDTATTFEDKPDMDIGFKPAADNKDLEELWVHIKDTPLHKALRFGIIETQNQTSLHAVVHNRQVRPRKTFNGRVHFRYSGSDRPKAEVEEQLKVIESSFNEWAQSMDVEAGTGSGEPVSIDVAYIE